MRLEAIRRRLREVGVDRPGAYEDGDLVPSSIARCSAKLCRFC
jgi:hypothetical protein